MRKRCLIIICLCLCAITTYAQKKFSVYAVGFYNQENLFDYTHDEGKNDYDFTPNGSYHWNEMKYTHKLANMSQVLAEMGTDVLPNVGCAFIGLAECENEHVVKDLVAQPALAQRNYQYVHIEGPDKRGFLTVSGTMANEHVTVIVCHLPSRGAGSYYRELGAKQVKVLKDSLLQEDPNCKIFVMGDMNDDPMDASMHKSLSAKAEITEVGSNDMYNPWYNILAKQGHGTLQYQGKWNLFDQIILSPNLLNKEGTKDYTTLKYWKSQIFRRDYLFQQEGKYKGNTKRTTAGGVWLDGYSDHLPVVTYLAKEQK